MRQGNIMVKRNYNVKQLKSYYDAENDLFYAHKENTKVFSNIMLGDFHIEYDREGNIVGIEVLNATDVLKEYGVSKEMLKQMQDVQIKVIEKQSTILVWLIIVGKGKEQGIPITVNNPESPMQQLIARK